MERVETDEQGVGAPGTVVVKTLTCLLFNKKAFGSGRVSEHSVTPVCGAGCLGTPVSLSSIIPFHKSAKSRQGGSTFPLNQRCDQRNAVLRCRRYFSA